ncbi:hypothetical protein ASD56_11335 [Microbacterium sp. Root166]|uniref:hypothetical protein n=1 Tax=Microbacterium sp. Root166 TaxID=1736478 RepID=UPI0006FB5BA4|nr:hypothetical protein [Microbacterium sp. Root166]KQZ84534.1 hypothetical protein ASD56_11335 [Microbacterium sp. Root166]
MLVNSSSAVELVDLRDFGSDQALSNAFDRLTATVGAVAPILLLDSVDETRLLIRHFVRFLEQRLRPLIAAGWRVIAVCRTAESVRALDALFESLEDKAVHVLLPLRRSDVETIAEERGIDGADFMGQVERRRLESLAATPYTLSLLLTIYAADGGLPGSRQLIFERALSLMMAADSIGNYTPRQAEDASPARQRAALARLAGYATFTDAGDFALYEVGQRSAGTQTDRLVGTTTVDGVTVEVNNDDLQLALRTPVFAHSGSTERQFAHRRLRDFLAAEQLAGASLSHAQLRSVLLVGDGETIPPQMADVATWLVALNQDAFAWLLDADPLTLVRNRITQDDTTIARGLVARLTERADDFDRDISWRDDLSGLEYDEMESDFSRFLTQDESTQRVALRILRDSYRGGLEADLQRTLEDRNLSVNTRVLAADVVSTHNIEGVLRSLRWGADEFFEGDSNSELRGKVLDALWPRYITAEELTEGLVRAPESFFGSYFVFLSTLANEMTEDLALAVIRRASPVVDASVADDGGLSETNEWEHDEFDPDDLQRLVDSAIRVLATLPELEDDVRTLLARAVARRLSGDRSKLPFARASIQPREFRALIERLVTVYDGDLPAWYGLLTARDADGEPLITRSDLDWLAESAERGSEDELRVWTALIDQLLDATSDADMAWAWHHNHGRLWAGLRHRFDPVDLDSDIARTQREHWEFGQRFNDRPPDRSLSVSEYLAAFRNAATRVRTAPLGFWHLVRLLGLDLATRRYQFSFEADLLDLENVDLLDDSDRTCILDLAHAYLVAITSPDRPFPKQFKKDRFHLGIQACYQALYTLLKHEPHRLDDLEDAVWAIANIAILEAQTTSRDSATTDFRRALLEMSAAKNRPNLRRSIRAFFGRVGRGTSSAAALPALTTLIDSDLLSALRPAVLASERHRDSLADLLLQVDPIDGREWMRRRIGKSINEHELATLIGSLLTSNPSFGYEVLLEFCDRAPTLVRSVLLLVGSHERYGGDRIREVSPEDRVAFYVRLAALFPASEDDIPTGVHSVTPREDVAYWRAALLDSVASSGSKAGLAALLQAAREHPELDLAYAVATARESYRVNGWMPLSIGEFTTILAVSNSVLARSANDVLAATVDALGTIQHWLTDETPQSFALWNIAPNYKSPKDENRLSDWYTHALRVILDRGGFIVNREVEVRRVSDHGVGHRQDIRVEVRDPHSGDVFVVVIEVKGIWNSAVRTSLLDQLAADYLVRGGLTHGIYLVVDFDPSQMTRQSNARRSMRNRHGLNELLHQQAQSLEPALRITPVVHDASLPT